VSYSADTTGSVGDDIHSDKGGHHELMERGSDADKGNEESVQDR
jgi:hypothetical protein